MDVLFRKKPPRSKKRCARCFRGFGLMRPNFPYCSFSCRIIAEEPPDELMELLRYPSWPLF
jgi:hypothetical protein